MWGIVVAVSNSLGPLMSSILVGIDPSALLPHDDITIIADEGMVKVGIATIALMIDLRIITPVHLKYK
jgi:hypothetical protein